MQAIPNRALLLLFGLSLLAGCGGPVAGNFASDGAVGVSGHVHGGEQPVSGATIQMYTVGTTGDGSAAGTLLPVVNPITTDANGGFNITNKYSCTSATEVYLVATGGDSQPGTPNPNLALMAALGPCGNLGSGTNIVVNELTTVAAVSSLAPYMSSTAAVGSGTGDVAGLNAAFTTASELVNTSTGTAPGASVPAGMTVPVSELDTLADIVALCINSGGGTAGSNTPCGTLFNLTIVGNSTPADTITALLNLAKNPTLNTYPLWQTASTNGPFQPILAAQPPSFAVQLSPAVVTLSPATLSFPSTPVGATATAQTAVLANSGSGAVSLGGVSLLGANAGDFAETNNCPSSLAAGAVCTIQISFSPLATGGRNASLAAAEAGSVVTSSLTGTSVAATTGPVTLSATALTFYQTGLPQQVTVSNYGTGPLAIATIQISSPNFSEVDNCGNQLSAQSVCNIYVSATAGAGNFTGTLTVVDSDTTDAQTVQLASYMQFTQSVFFGSVAVGTDYNYLPFSGQGVLIGTHNGQPLYQYTTSVSGINAGDFLVASSMGPNCDSSGIAYCTVDYSFEPSATGWRYATLTDNAGGIYQLQGYGLSSAKAFFFNSPIVNFGNVSVGSSASQSVTVTNASTVDLTFPVSYPSFPTINPAVSTGALNNGDFTATISTCNIDSSNPSASLAGGTAQSYFYTCTIKVTFQPTTTGQRSATVTLSEASGLQQGFLVEGGGLPAPPSVPATVNLGNAQPNATSAVKMVTAVLPGNDAATAQVSGAGFALSGSTYCIQGVALCQFGITFTPSALGAVTGTLMVTDATTGVSATSTLQGTGGVSTATLNMSSLTFVPRTVGTQSLAQTVTITNNGNAALTVTVSISGTNATSFGQTNTCSAAVAVGSYCTVSVTNTPAVTGELVANLLITGNATAMPQVVTLSGTGQ